MKKKKNLHHYRCSIILKSKIFLEYIFKNGLWPLCLLESHLKAPMSKNSVVSGYYKTKKNIFDNLINHWIVKLLNIVIDIILSVLWFFQQRFGAVVSHLKF